MSRKRFAGLLDAPNLFDDIEAQPAAVDPEGLEAKPAEACPSCGWLSLEDPCEQCGAPRGAEAPAEGP